MQKLGSTYIFTSHALSKMRHYRMSESVVRKIIRHPDRVEEGVVEDFIASMKETGSKSYPEAWVMYKPINEVDNHGISRSSLKILTAWKYPGKSKERNIIPDEVLREVRSIIGF